MKHDSAEYEYEVVESNWVMRHPSASVTIFVLFIGFIQYIASNWLSQQDAPRWDKFDKSIDELKSRDRAIAGYLLEQNRYTNGALKAIANASGAELPSKHDDLKRSMAQVRGIRDDN